MSTGPGPAFGPIHTMTYWILQATNPDDEWVGIINYDDQAAAEAALADELAYDPNWRLVKKTYETPIQY